MLRQACDILLLSPTSRRCAKLVYPVNIDANGPSVELLGSISAVGFREQKDRDSLIRSTIFLLAILVSERTRKVSLYTGLLKAVKIFITAFFRLLIEFQFWPSENFLDFSEQECETSCTIYHFRLDIRRTSKEGSQRQVWYNTRQMYLDLRQVRSIANNRQIFVRHPKILNFSSKNVKTSCTIYHSRLDVRRSMKEGSPRQAWYNSKEVRM